MSNRCTAAWTLYTVSVITVSVDKMTQLTAPQNCAAVLEKQAVVYTLIKTCGLLPCCFSKNVDYYCQPFMCHTKASQAYLL